MRRIKAIILYFQIREYQMIKDHAIDMWVLTETVNIPSVYKATTRFVGYTKFSCKWDRLMRSGAVINNLMNYV